MENCEQFARIIWNSIISRHIGENAIFVTRMAPIYSTELIIFYCNVLQELDMENCEKSNHLIKIAKQLKHLSENAVWKIQL